MELMNRRVAALLFCAYLCFFSTWGVNGDSPSGREKRLREAASLGQVSVFPFSEPSFFERCGNVVRRCMFKVQGSESGPGSYPPRCTLKCGECSPCCPVHVPVPPGTPVIAEYYPEAWRCKCGNLLFMP